MAIQWPSGIFRFRTHTIAVGDVTDPLNPRIFHIEEAVVIQDLSISIDFASGKSISEQIFMTKGGEYL